MLVHAFKKNSTSRSRNRSLLVDGFKPRTWEEQRVLKIAKLAGETQMDFLLSILDRFGYRLIESAWQEFQEVEASGKTIHSKRRFLNYLIQQRRRGDAMY